MKQLSNRRILVGVTGGIAAYKSAELVRALRANHAQVQVVMTRAAREFITPLTLQALSGNPVHTDLLDPAAEAAMGHIELARWADRIVVAPATADFVARIASGRGDDLLTTLCLASEAPLMLAPAMNQAMWRDASTQANIALLKARGARMMGPAEGEQACGDVGPGRMMEPLQIAELVAADFSTRALDGVRVTVTAGPTREAIDPVRYISNHSSGKMGYALATAARDAGAVVTLISGPVRLPPPDDVDVVNVVSAQDMYDAAMAQMGLCDVFIACAAVADYRPVTVAEQKIKKSADSMTMELTRNPDTVAAVAGHAQRPFTVGFAAETEALIEHARGKLQRKNLDVIIANNVADTAIGFDSDENAVTLISADDSQIFARCSKHQLAHQLIADLAIRFNRAKSS